MKLPTRKSIAIVADGQSASPLRHFDIPQEIYIIAVNHASIWLPRVSAYFTAVPDARQRWLMNHQRQGVRYFAAAPDTYASKLVHGQNALPRERNVTFFRQWLFDSSESGAAPSLPLLPCGVKDGPINSAFGAMMLAVHLGAERIAIIGMDLNDKPRVSGGRATGLAGVVDLFKPWGCLNVVNGSQHSPVTAFPKMSPTEAIQWLL